jgi:hypothetical protein
VTCDDGEIALNAVCAAGAARLQSERLISSAPTRRADERILRAVNGAGAK